MAAISRLFLDTAPLTCATQVESSNMSAIKVIPAPFLPGSFVMEMRYMYLYVLCFDSFRDGVLCRTVCPVSSLAKPGMDFGLGDEQYHQ